MKQYLALALALGACGGDDGGGGGTQDAAVMVDANTNKVREIGCPASPAATVMTVDNVDAYSPMSSTISVNGIVRFVISGAHDVSPNPIGGSTDPGLVVASGDTTCLQFTQAGTYNFYCSPHGFTGSIVVQ
jgi:plastocyanin